MSDDVIFQSSTPATPPNATRVATDFVDSRHHQLIKIEFGDNGTAYAVSYGTPLPIGTLPGGTFSVNGTLQVLGSVSIVGTLAGGTVGILGTVQGLGTYQPLAGSVHVANTISGTVQTHGTSQVIGTVQPLAGSVHVAAPISGTVQVHGTIPVGTIAGTVSALGTVQPLAGSVHPAAIFFGSVQGWAAHDAAAAGAPVLIGAFGSSGTQAAVGDGDAVRLWADLNGRLQVRGTIDSMPTVTVIATNLDIRDLTSASDSVSVVGTVQTHGTSQALGTIQPLAGSVHVANTVSGTVQVHGTVPVGTVAGTVSVLGTVQPLAGSVHLATNLAGGTVVSVGSAVHGAVADTRPHLIGVFGSSGTPAAVDDGDAVRLWADLNGRLQIRGTIDSMPAISVTQGTIPGGTVQLHGTSQILGTVRALTEVTVTVGTIAEGTIQSFTGTAQVLGTIQPLAGSVHLATGLPGGTVVTVGSAVHGAVADARPHLMAAFGSSGTQVAVDDGDSVRLWADLNGRLQVRGTIDSIPSITIGAALPAGDNNIGNVDVVTMPTVTVTGTVQTHGTVSVGTVAGTVSVLGTMQPLAGSVHLASILPGGSVSAQGYVAHDAVAAGNPLLMGAFGSSGTQAAIADGDAVRLWADLNGRLQVRGTIDSLPSVTVGNTVAVTGTVQTHGTSQALGTVQPLAGSVHLATNLAGGTVVNVGSAVHGAAADTRPLLMGVFGSSGTQAAVDDGDSTRLWADLNGRLQIRGTIDSIPAITITAGTVSLNTGGTIHIGTVQRVAGTVDIGTVAGTVAVRTAFPTFGSYFGSAFTAATSNGTLIAPLGQGTRWRLHDVTVSASAAGTVQLTEATSGSVVWGPLFFAANGGMQSNSALGYRARGTNLGLFVTTSAGTTSVTVNYQLETP